MNQQNYAGFWIRLGASLIDLIIIMFIIFLPLYYIYGEEYFTSEQYYLGFWDVFLGELVPFLATIWFWIRFAATPGKILCKIKVVDAKTTKKLTLGQSVLRYIGYFLSIIALGVGFFSIAWDKKKQGWHDKLAATIVIKESVGRTSVRKF